MGKTKDEVFYMRKKKLFLAALLIAATLSISACDNAESNYTPSENSINEIDNYNQDIYKIYKLYLEQGGDLTYEQWLESIRGKDGVDGKDGQDGHSPVITIGQDGFWYIDGVNTNVKAQGEQGPQGEKGDKGDTGDQGPQGNQGSQGEQGPKGDQGDAGQKGEDGTSVLTGNGAPSSNLGKIGDSYIDLSSWDYYVKTENGWIKQGNIKGEQGSQGNQGSQGDTGPQGPQGPQGQAGQNGQDGVSVVSIVKTSSEGLVDTYTITYSDGHTSTFTVTNGANGQNGQSGAQGEQGIQGNPGADGHTPVITIGNNGNWYVDGIDTGIQAQGPQGPAGQKGEDGKSIYTGNGVPSELLGKDGDSFVNLDTWDFYLKIGDEWISYGNIKGTNGSNGLNGQNGASAYQIFLNYNPNYTGTEEEWINDLASNNICHLFGHQYKYTSKKQPTLYEDGANISVCSVCGDVIEEIIPKLGGKNDRFAYVLNDGKAAIVEYFGEESILEIPSSINGVPVTQIGCAGLNIDISYNYAPIKAILPSSVDTIEPGFFDRCCINVKYVEGLENIKVCISGLGNVEDAVFSDNLERIGSFFHQKTVTLPDDVELLYGEKGGLILNRITLIDGSGEKTIKEEDGVIFSADGSELLIYPTSRDAYSYSVPNTVSKIATDAFYACGYKLKELYVPNSVTDITTLSFGSSGSFSCDYITDVGSAAYDVFLQLKEMSPLNCYVSTNGETTESMVRDIVEECCDDSNDDYSNALALHDWLIDNVDYDFSNNYVSANQMLRYKTGVCAAYADTYHFLLNEAGIENMVVGNFNHAWVAAKLDDYWTYIDPTWDDVGSGNEIERHRYFGFDNSVRNTVYGASYPELVNQRIVYLDDVDASNANMHYWKRYGYLNEDIALYDQTIRDHLNSGDYNFVIPMNSAQSDVSDVASLTIAASLSNNLYTIDNVEYHVSCGYSEGSYYVYASSTELEQNELFDISIQNGMVKIDHYKGNELNVEIPSTINGLQVGYIGRAFYGNDYIRSVTLPEGLVEIGGNAFLGCYSLRQVSIPSTVKTIGDLAFCYCNNLESDILLPEGLTYLGSMAFAFNYKIKKASVPSTITTFRDMAFMDCTSLTTVKLSEGLICVGVACFAGCASLRSVKLPESLQAINTNAFGSTAIETIYIPKNVNYIGIDAFYKLKLKQVVVDEDNQYYKVVNNAVVSADGYLNRVLIANIDNEYIVQYGVTTIGYRAFIDAENLEIVYIPYTVERIEGECFALCANLKTIYYDGTIEEWNSISFASDWAQRHLYIPNESITIICSNGTITIHP
ncbi:MAG: leucine-rich repeat protein [Bacilli bacterium]|nr:leucine-rich repeat protein [Bacilli bacterium]